MSKRASKAPSFYEPYTLFLVFAGVSVGTFLLQQPVRLALLWTTLLILCVLHQGSHKVEVGFSLPALGRGMLLGLVISLPLLAFLSEQLRDFAERLYATKDVISLFYQVCLVSAPIEEFFFRGVVQERKGSSVSVALYAGAALLYFLPHAPILATFIVFLAMGALGTLYAYVCEHYGLAASVGCHVVVGFVLQVVPSLIATLRMMLS